MGLPVLLWPSKTLLMFSSFLPAQRVRELLLSLLTTPSLLPLLDVSLLVPSPIRSRLLPPSRLLPKSTSKRTGPNPLLRAPTGLMKHQHPPLLLPLPSLSLPGKIGPALLLMTGAHLLLPPPVTGVLLPLPTGLKKANFSCYL